MDYWNSRGRDDRLTGGVRKIPITTPSGSYRVWTRRVGNDPRKKMLLLHGGPGASHEYLAAFDSFLPEAEIEYYYYDQLGSFFSDQPDDPSLWNTERFVDEVEQVRVALGLGPENFYLFGHSWGGILAIEYALRHPGQLKALVISNMMASIPAYNEYTERVLAPNVDPAALAEIKALEDAGDFENPRHFELLLEHYYVDHILRMPPEEWPDPVERGFGHINGPLYRAMQGPSELGASGALLHWDRVRDLARIEVPTLVMGAAHDTMDPEHLRQMAEAIPAGRYHHCPEGSHLAMYDDQETYFTGLLEFVREVEAG